MEKQNILQRIKGHQGRFSQQQAKIAAYIINNYEKAAFLTATQLAREAGVSQPTVIRFSQYLGFSQYGAFLETIQDLLKTEFTSVDRLRLSIGKNDTGDDFEFDTISWEIKTLETLANTFPSNAFKAVVEKICTSDRVFIVGTRGSASLAQYFAYFLGKVKNDVTAITSGATREYDRILCLGQNDLVIAIAFPRYPRETMDIVNYCRKKNDSIYGITDKIDSPLTELTDTVIAIPITFSTIFDSYCSAMCLFNMIVTGVGKTNRKESEALSKEFEALVRITNMFV